MYQGLTQCIDKANYQYYLGILALENGYNLQ